MCYNNTDETEDSEMSNINLRKIGIVGCGFVGAASAFALMQSGLFTEMVLIDADPAKAEGESAGG